MPDRSKGNSTRCPEPVQDISVAYHIHNVVVTVKRDHEDDLHHSAASAASGGGGGSTIAAARILALDERMLEDW